MSNDDDVTYVPNTMEEFKTLRIEFYTTSRTVEDKTSLLTLVNDSKEDFTDNVHRAMAFDSVVELLQSVKHFRNVVSIYELSCEVMLERYGIEELEQQTADRDYPNLLPIRYWVESYNKIVCPASIAIFHFLIMKEADTRWKNRVEKFGRGENPDADVVEETLRVNIYPVLGAGIARYHSASICALEKIEASLNWLDSLNHEEGRMLLAENVRQFISEVKFRDRRVQLYIHLVRTSFSFLQKEQERVERTVGLKAYFFAAHKEGHGEAYKKMKRKLGELEQTYADCQYPDPIDADTLFDLPDVRGDEENDTTNYFERMWRRLISGGLFEDGDLELVAEYPTLFLNGIVGVDS